MSGSIRQRAEAQRDRHHRMGHRDKCNSCERIWPCPDWVDADDTITDLNNARRVMVTDFETGEEFPLIYREIPDPLPAASGSGGAQTTPNTA